MLHTDLSVRIVDTILLSMCQSHIAEPHQVSRLVRREPRVTGVKATCRWPARSGHGSAIVRVALRGVNGRSDDKVCDCGILLDVPEHETCITKLGGNVSIQKTCSDLPTCEHVGLCQSLPGHRTRNESNSP
jgi:hypothetical protein